jgi:hypothetical protein
MPAVLKECPFCGIGAIEWNFAPVLPDADTTVLVHLEGAEPELAYHSDGKWHCTRDGFVIHYRVVAWCHVPYPPERTRVKQAGKPLRPVPLAAEVAAARTGYGPHTKRPRRIGGAR